MMACRDLHDHLMRSSEEGRDTLLFLRLSAGYDYLSPLSPLPELPPHSPPLSDSSHISRVENYIYKVLNVPCTRSNTQHHAASRSITQLHAASRSITQLHAASRSFTQLHAASRSFTQLHAASRSFTQLHAASRNNPSNKQHYAASHVISFFPLILYLSLSSPRLPPNLFIIHLFSPPALFFFVIF